MNSWFQGILSYWILYFLSLPVGWNVSPLVKAPCCLPLLRWVCCLLSFPPRWKVFQGNYYTMNLMKLLDLSPWLPFWSHFRCCLRAEQILSTEEPLRCPLESARSFHFFIPVSNFLITTFTYVCIFLGVCTHVHAHVCTCMWRPEVSLSCFSTLSFETVSHLSGTHKFI